MKCVALIRKPVEAITVILAVAVVCVLAQEPQRSRQTTTPRRATFLKAFVVDDRLSALRREPTLYSEVVRRLHLGRSIYIIRGSSRERFHRVAVTRRTRGWIHESALAIQGRAGEDQRIMKLIDGNRDKTNTDIIDQITLCRILIDHFPASRLVPRWLLRMGEEAERAAEAFSPRARKRLADGGRGEPEVSMREYYLSDASLDRFSRVRIVFDFNESAGEYVYEGNAYREIVKRFPRAGEAKVARERLEVAKQKMARRE